MIFLFSFFLKMKKFALFQRREDKKPRDSKPISVAEISAPSGFTKLAHVGVDNQTGKLVGLPPAWQQMVGNNFTRKEQQENPDAVMNSVKFLQKIAIKMGQTGTGDVEPAKYLYSAGSMGSLENLADIDEHPSAASGAMSREKSPFRSPATAPLSPTGPSPKSNLLTPAATSVTLKPGAKEQPAKKTEKTTVRT